MAETGIPGLKFCFDQFVPIEIHESDLALGKLISEIRLVEEQIRVAMMARSFPDGDRGGIQTKEGLGCSADELCIRVHRLPRKVFNDIWLQQN